VSLHPLTRFELWSGGERVAETSPSVTANRAVGVLRWAPTSAGDHLVVLRTIDIAGHAAHAAPVRMHTNELPLDLVADGSADSGPALGAAKRIDVEAWSHDGTSAYKVGSGTLVAGEGEKPFMPVLLGRAPTDLDIVVTKMAACHRLRPQWTSRWSSIGRISRTPGTSTAFGSSRTRSPPRRTPAPTRHRRT
jgi:hypothetical protein